MLPESTLWPAARILIGVIAVLILRCLFEKLGEQKKDQTRPLTHIITYLVLITGFLLFDICQHIVWEQFVKGFLPIPLVIFIAGACIHFNICEEVAFLHYVLLVPTLYKLTCTQLEVPNWLAGWDAIFSIVCTLNIFQVRSKRNLWSFLKGEMITQLPTARFSGVKSVVSVILAQLTTHIWCKFAYQAQPNTLLPSDPIIFSLMMLRAVIPMIQVTRTLFPGFGPTDAVAPICLGTVRIAGLENETSLRQRVIIYLTLATANTINPAGGNNLSILLNKNFQ